MSFRLFDEDNVKPYLVSAFFDILFSTASICVVQGFLYWGFRGSPPPQLAKHLDNHSSERNLPQ